jgi:hypothetical protein
MGFEGIEERAQFHPGLSAFRSWEKPCTYDQDHALRNKHILATLAAGSTTYASAIDSDLQSVNSDDAISVADSVFDTASVASSQSSYGSSGSDSSEDSSDGEHAPTSRNRSTSTTKNSHTGYETLPELLSGLGQESLPLRFNLNKSDDTHHAIRQPHQQGPVNQHLDQVDDAQRVKSHQEQQTSFKQPPCAPQKTNRRRSVSSETSAPPCRLKRDTDSADCFVMMLISKCISHASLSLPCLTLPSAFAAKLITAIWPLSACPPMMSSCFNGAGVLPLEVFIHETLRRSKTSYSTLQVALWYLMLLKCQLPKTDLTKEQGQSTCRAMQCGRRMFLAALMLASKYLQDRNYSTRAWSKISGLRVCEINENEMKYLQAIDYKLHITKDVFDNWSRVVLALSRLSKLKPGSPILDSQLRGLVNDHMPSLGDMADPDHALPDEETLFSESWWRNVFTKLDPSVCDTDAGSRSFLSQISPSFDLLHPMLPAQGLSGTFDSPPNQAQSAFSSPAMQSLQSGASTPVQGFDGQAQSQTSLPLRPQLRNLPTPLSTPRGVEGYLSTPSGMNLRCSASVDALRNVRKQCLANAVERCPPPRPQSLQSPLHPRMRPAASIPYQLPSPATSSPLSSAGSDNICTGSRSRSSSISSNSSWTSGFNGQPTNGCIRPDNFLSRPQEPSPLTRVVSMPETRVAGSRGHKLPPLRRMQQFSDIAAARRHAAAAKSCPKYGESKCLLQEKDAAAALLRLHAGRHETQQQMLRAAQQVIPEAENSSRGHKRNISNAESLHENVRNILQQESDGDELMSDPAMKIHNSSESIEKKWQMPARNWALPKKPVDTFDHKRIALYCTPAGQLSAPELTALQLKEQLVSV